MNHFYRRLILYALILTGLIYLSASGKCTSSSEKVTGPVRSELLQPLYEGYMDAVPYKGQFLSVGTGGRIDFIDFSGTKSRTFDEHKDNLNCAVVWEDFALVAGDGGSVLRTEDGVIFEKAETGTDRDINGIAARRDMIVAGADEGTLLVSVNSKSWNTVEPGVRGNIVSVAAGLQMFIAVTDEGEIIKSDDGLNWKVTDYNKEYSGFYKPCIFSEVLAAGNNIVICGKHTDGSPAVITSTLGNVWTERLLNYRDDHGSISFLVNCPNSVAYDEPRDQYILACGNGEIFSLPSCTKCNASAIISGKDLHAIACLGDVMFCGGEGFSVNVIRF